MNTYCLFNELNQWWERFTWHLCSLYAVAINLKYNCGIVLTKDDIKKIAERQVKLWLLSLTEWWKGLDWINAVNNFLKENKDRFWELPTLIKFKKDNTEIFNNLKNHWFAIICWIWVNKEFPKDVQDWKLENFNDYKKYKWDYLRHFTNVVKWKDWWKEKPPFWRYYNHEFILDSYAFNTKDREWMYYGDIEKMRQTFIYPSCYAFIK